MDVIPGSTEQFWIAEGDNVDMANTAQFCRQERRVDNALADSIDVCLIYRDVYGMMPACIFLHECDVPWSIAFRVLTTCNWRRRGR
jgi:hypothetical protein